MSLTFPKQKFASYCLPFFYKTVPAEQKPGDRNNRRIHHGHTIPEREVVGKGVQLNSSPF